MKISMHIHQYCDGTKRYEHEEKVRHCHDWPMIDALVLCSQRVETFDTIKEVPLGTSGYARPYARRGRALSFRGLQEHGRDEG